MNVSSSPAPTVAPVSFEIVRFPQDVESVEHFWARAREVFDSTVAVGLEPPKHGPLPKRSEECPDPGTLVRVMFNMDGKPIGFVERDEPRADSGSDSASDISDNGRPTFAEVDEQTKNMSEKESNSWFEGTVPNLAHPWHPLFFDRVLRVEEFVPVASLIVGGSIRVPVGDFTRSLLYDRLRSVLKTFSQEFPSQFTAQFLHNLLEELIGSVALLNKLSISSQLYTGYIIARVVKKAPIDYDACMDAIFKNIETVEITPSKLQSLYMAYFLTKHSMDAFRRATMWHLLRSKSNSPTNQNEVNEGIISTLWKLPKSADALLTNFIAFPREILQGEDEASLEEYLKQEFLDDFLVSSRRFMSLYNDILGPWYKIAASKKNPMRQWNSIGCVLRNLAKLERYHQGEHKHPLKSFLKKIARAVLGRDVAEQQMLSGLVAPRLDETLGKASEFMDEVKTTLRGSGEKFNAFVEAAQTRSTDLEFTMREARITMAAAQTAAHGANHSLDSLNGLVARASAVLDQFVPEVGSTSEKLKADLAQGVKKGVDNSNLGGAIKLLMGSGKSVIETFSKIVEIVGTLLPYILVPVFIWSSHHALNSPDNRVFNGTIAALSGIYLIAKYTSLSVNAGLIGSIVTALKSFWRSPGDTNYGSVGDEGDIARQEGVFELPMSVWTSLTIAFTSFGFSKAGSKVDSFKAACKDVQSSARGLESMITSAISFVLSFADDIKGWLGIECKTSNLKLLDFVDDITEFTAEFKSGVAAPSKFMLSRASELYETGMVYATSFKKSGNHSEEAIVQRQLRTLEMVTAEIKKVMSVPVKPRAMPVSLVFMGEPGCGKTVFTRFLERLLFKYELTKMDPQAASILESIYNTSPLSLCYHKGQDFYWDAISPTTMIVTMDDWLQRTTVPGSDYAPLMDFIGMANTEPWAPRMAYSKEEKWIAPSYVFASTNATRFHDETIKDVDAVYRRIDYLCDVKLDKSRVKDGKFTLDAYTFTLMEWIPNRSQQPQKGVARPRTTVSAKELIGMVIRKRISKLKDQAGMDTTMSAMVDDIAKHEFDIHSADIWLNEDEVEQEEAAQQEMAMPDLDAPERPGPLGATTLSRAPEPQFELGRLWPDFEWLPEPMEEVDLGERPDSPRVVEAPEVSMAYPVAIEDCGLIPEGAKVTIPWAGSIELDSLVLESLAYPDARRYEASSTYSIDDRVPSTPTIREPGIGDRLYNRHQALRLIRQEFYDRTGIVTSLEKVDAQMAAAGVDAKKIDASKLRGVLSSLDFTKIGLGIKASFDWTVEKAEQTRSCFTSLADGVYKALIELKEFFIRHRAIFAAAISFGAMGATAFMGLSWLMKDPSADPESASTFAHVHKIKQHRRPHQPGGPTNVRPQMGSDRFDSVREKLRKNMYDVYGPDVEGRIGKYMGTINGVCDRVFHAPYHFLKKNVAMWDAHGLDPGKRKWFLKQDDVTHVVPFSDVTLLGDEETAYALDRAIFSIRASPGCTLPMCANVFAHYITDNEIGDARYRHNVDFPVCLFNRKHLMDEKSACYITSKRANCVHGSQGDAILYEDYDVRDLFQYRVTTAPGDCGTLMMAIDGTTPRIMGAHVLGSNKTGFAYRITADDIKKAIYGVIKDNPQAIEVPDYKIEIGDTNPELIVQACAYDISVHTCMSDPFMKPKGSVFTSSFLTRYTGNGEDYVPFNQAVTDTSPSAYARARAPYCAKIFENQAKQKDYMVMLQACAESVTNDLKRLKWDRSHRLYQYREAVLGIAGTNFKAIDFGTSSGYPWMNRGITKRKIGRFVDNLFQPGKAYVDLFPVVEDVLQKLAQEAVPEMTYLDTLKVEWRDVAKASTPRLVSAAPIEAVISGRMLFGSFMHFMCDMGLDAETLIGFNPYADSDTFAARFLKFGNLDNCACADYKGFDTDHTPELSMLCAEIINSVMGGTDAEQRARSTYIWSIAHSKHIRGSIMEVWDGSMPSGNVLTAIINCLINMILVRFIWLRANKYETSCLPKFKNHVVFACLGDDNGVAVAPEYVQHFTEKAQADSVALLGYRMTSATKGAELREVMTGFSEMEILKRVPRYDEERMKWLLPLRLSVVLYMPMKTKKNDYLTIARDNLETALHELSLHDHEEWHRWVPKMVEFCSIDFKPTSTCRNYYLDRVLNEGYYDPALFDGLDSE